MKAVNKSLDETKKLGSIQLPPALNKSYAETRNYIPQTVNLDGYAQMPRNLVKPYTNNKFLNYIDHASNKRAVEAMKNLHLDNFNPVSHPETEIKTPEIGRKRLHMNHEHKAIFRGVSCEVEKGSRFSTLATEPSKDLVDKIVLQHKLNNRTIIEPLQQIEKTKNSAITVSTSSNKSPCSFLVGPANFTYDPEVNKSNRYRR